MSASSRGTVAILGAGPTGLEAALACAEAGLPFALYEAGPRVASHVRAWGHVRLFTPWSLSVSPRMRRRLDAAGVAVPDGDVCPTGAELVAKALEPAAALPEVAAGLRCGARVAAVGREGLLKHEEIGTAERAARVFRLLLADGEGREWVERADVILDATGTWSQPNALGDGGIPAPGEEAFAGRIVRHVPDVEGEPDAWAGRTVLLAGAGHSAQTAAVALAALARDHPATSVVWALRSPEPRWQVDPSDPLPERRRLVEAARDLAASDGAVRALAGVVVEALRPAGERIEVVLRGDDGSRRVEVVDRILSLTGYVGDSALTRQLQVHECYATGAPMRLSAALLGTAGGDCLAQTSHGVETLANPEPRLYILGAKSYGRNSNFLMRVGWEQVEEVVALLAGCDAPPQGTVIDQAEVSPVSKPSPKTQVSPTQR
jgi:thioredoxin reductase